MSSTVLRRGGSAVVFAIVGDCPTFSQLPELLAKHRFRTIEDAATDEVSVGWCTPLDPSGGSFELEDMDAGGVAAWLRVRVDRKRLPAKRLQIHLAAAEKAKGRGLSATERRLVKEDVTAALMPRVLPATAFVDVLVDLAFARVMLFTTAKAAGDAFASLWHHTFGSVVERLRPSRLAPVGFADVIMPARFAGRVAQGLLPGSGPADFLGSEFLLWVWWTWETTGGDIPLGESQIGLMLDDLVAWRADRDGADSDLVLRHGLPTRSPEARAALRSGRPPTRARLIVATGAKQWLVTLDAESWAFGAVKLPEDAEEIERDELTAARAADWLHLSQLLQYLFAWFVGVRSDAQQWKQVSAEISAWMQP